MKTVAIVSIALVVALLAGGAVFVRLAAQPEEDELSSDPAGEDDIWFEETSQFLQEAPVGGPPQTVGTSEEEVLAEEEADEAAQEAEVSATAEVSMTASGFQPAQLTVAAGTAVTFTNTSQALKWPASDPHPTHTILPAFDSGEGLSSGETFTFTFTDTGRWRYHDHLNPTQTGVVIVE